MIHMKPLCCFTNIHLLYVTFACFVDCRLWRYVDALTSPESINSYFTLVRKIFILNYNFPTSRGLHENLRRVPRNLTTASKK